jgi:hypothetical protein
MYTDESPVSFRTRHDTPKVLCPVELTMDRVLLSRSSCETLEEL